MSHHINKQGQFQSDKYPELAPDKIMLSFKDKAAQIALIMFADNTSDIELAEDILTRIKSIKTETDHEEE